MIEKIFSKVEKDKLLHIVYRPDNSQTDYRENIIESNNFIQCSFLRLPKSKTFIPHKHIKKDRRYEQQIAQESWVVLSGSVKCIFYDLDNTIISTPILNSGDASFTLEGGHTYEILEDDTIVYEYKTGPYEGQELDKEFI
jgi:hypothetical protein